MKISLVDPMDGEALVKRFEKNSNDGKVTQSDGLQKTNISAELRNGIRRFQLENAARI